MEVVEKYLQIPLPEDYIERLNKRAAEYDRVMSREGVMWRVVRVAGEILGMIAILAMAAAVAWLCCAASGYHWE